MCGGSSRTVAAVDLRTVNRTAVIAAVVASLATAGVCLIAFGQNRKDPSSPTIDVSSEAKFRASLDAVKRSLPEGRQEEFERATILAMLAERDGRARRLRAHLDEGTEQQDPAAGAEAPAGGAIDFSRTRKAANESAAIATLKNISSAQSQCQAAAVIDANANGAGEYGFFAELAGATGVRSNESGDVGTECINPPVLSRAFAQVQGSRVMRSGYYFQVYLPNSAAAATAEADTGGASGVSVAAAHAEAIWLCYAWPTDRGTSGDRAFFINQDGDVLASRNVATKYSGTENVPAPLAAFSKNATDMCGAIAANATGADGERWLVVN